MAREQLVKIEELLREIEQENVCSIHWNSCKEQHNELRDLKKELYKPTRDLDDPLVVQLFEYERQGAALVLQNWSKHLTNKNKILYQKKYSKFLTKKKCEEKLRKAIRKTYLYHTITYKKLQNKQIYYNAIGTIISRIIRGYLGRKRYQKCLLMHKDYEKKKLRSIIIIQSIIRMFLVRVQYPSIGTRYRINIRKYQKYLTFKNDYNKNNMIYSILLKENSCMISNYDENYSTIKNDNNNNGPIMKNKKSYDNCNTLKDINLNRRPSIVLVNIRLGNRTHLDTLDNYVLRLNNCWRNYKRKLLNIDMRRNKNVFYILRIQRWYLVWKRRKQVLKSLLLLQPFWRFKIMKTLKNKYAAIKIQKFWMKLHTTAKFQKKKLIRKKSVLLIQKFLHTKYSLRQMKQKLIRFRQRIELVNAGLLFFKKTELFRHCYYLWAGIKKLRNVEAPHELQKTFKAYALNGNLDQLKFIKFCKDCKGLLYTSNSNNNGNDNDSNASNSDAITVNTLELQFTKVKGQTEKKIDYSKFVDLLMNLAKIKFIKTGNHKSNLHPNDIDNCPRNDEDETDIDADNYFYGGFHGKAGLVCQFTLTYVATNIEYKKVLAALGMRSALVLSTQEISAKVKVIQIFLINRLTIHKLTLTLKDLQDKKRKEKIYKASRTIQRVMRGFLGRRMIMHMAQSLYSKFLDGETNREYWYNPRTGNSYWTKPVLLGLYDCGMATRMPSDLEKFQVVCNVCEDNTATCFCDDCDDSYCTACYALNHKGGNRKKHVHIIIDNCIQCEFQAGTRVCLSCKDCFCDSCYDYFHSRGRLRFHVYTRTCDACEVCDIRSAQYKEIHYATSGDLNYYTKLWCNVCYHNEYGINASEVSAEDPEHLLKIKFYGKSVREYRERKEEERRKELLQQSFENRKLEIEKKKRDNAALTIQRTLRGFWCRRDIEMFIEKRKEFLILREAESAKRNGFLHKSLSFFGIAPKLKSDTPLERVKKLYPRYMRHVFEECIEYDYSEACRLLMQHENYMDNNIKSTIFQRISAKIAYRSAKKKFRWSIAQVEEKEIIYDNLRQQHMLAAKSGARSPDAMRKLANALNLAERDKNKAREQRRKYESAAIDADTNLKNVEGPLDLQKLVADRRKRGLLLPFTVSMKKNGKLALTEWQVPLDETEMDEEFDNLSEGYTAKGYELRPNAWKENLQIGDRVSINGIIFRIVQPNHGSSHSGKSTSQAGSRPSSRRNSAKASEDNDSESNGELQRSGSRISKSSGDAPTESAYGSLDIDVEVRIREVYTDDHMQLDRPWLLDDVHNLEIYKVMPLVFYQKPFLFIGRLALRSYPSQKIIAINAIFRYKISTLYAYLATYFDEESGSYAFLMKQSRAYREFSDFWLRRSYSVVQMSFDFTLRRRLYKIFFRSVFRLLKLLAQLLKGYIKKVALGTESPYDVWQKSLDKIEIKCVLELKGQDPIQLGYIKMDVLAPCDVMREYIQRNFREQLNGIIGDSFLFFVVNKETNMELVLEREKEEVTYSKDFLYEQTDKKTMITSLVVTLVSDPEVPPIMIPEFRNEDEENDDVVAIDSI